MSFSDDEQELTTPSPDALDDSINNAKMGHDDLIREMVETFGPSILETTDDDGKTALIWAADHRRDKTVKLLLELGAEVNAEDNDSMTPLIAAACAGAVGIIHILLDNHAQIESRYGQALLSPLHCAAWNGHTDAVTALLERGADLKAITGDGLSVLEAARKRANTETARVIEHEMSRRAFAEEARQMTEGTQKPISLSHSIQLRKPS